MSSQRIPAVESEGVAVVLATMRRFSSSRRLQYMGCWALVNMALEVILIHSFTTKLSLKFVEKYTAFFSAYICLLISSSLM